MVANPIRMLFLSRPFLTVEEFIKLIHGHFVTPLIRRIGLLLLVSLDFIGNPQQLLLGIVAGLREIFMQPYRRGLKGFFWGPVICFCSVMGSILDSFCRIINGLVKR